MSLADFLRQAQEGGSFLITSHGKALAELRPPPGLAETQDQVSLLSVQGLRASDLARLMPTLMPTAKRGKRPNNAIVPPSASAGSLQFSIKLSADDLRALAKEARLPLRITDEADLAAEARCLAETLEVAVLWERANSLPLLQKEVEEWRVALGRWLDDGTTLLGGKPGSGSVVRTLATGPVRAAAALLSENWPTETAEDGELVPPNPQRRLALLNDLKSASALDPAMAESIVQLLPSELGQDDNQDPPEFSEYNATTALLLKMHAALGALRILTEEMESHIGALRQRRSQKIDRWGLMRRLAYHYEKLFARGYTTSRIAQGRDNQGHPLGPAIRWTRALFIMAAKKGLSRGETLPELNELVEWSAKPHWGPEDIHPIKEWEKGRAMRGQGSLSD
ncbi:hypothetical protein [Teichococcus coralli]|nr:hypothetical protein [Pseudoroseomonas coralli]